MATLPPPGTAHAGLQRLAQLAGWHHPTPFRVGIDREWGTWFAYRVLEGGQFDFAKCAGYRKQAGSHCKATCLARIACPVGSAHRYCDAQIHHSYSRSMRAIECTIKRRPPDRT